MRSTLALLLAVSRAAPVDRECHLPAPTLPCADMCADDGWVRLAPNEWPYCRARGTTRVPMTIWNRIDGRAPTSALQFAPCGHVYGEAVNLVCDPFSADRLSAVGSMREDGDDSRGGGDSPV